MKVLIVMVNNDIVDDDSIDGDRSDNVVIFSRTLIITDVIVNMLSCYCWFFSKHLGGES